MQGGIIGLVLFSILIFTTARRFVIQKKLRELIILLGIFETLLFNPMSVVNLLAFWWVVGQSLHKEPF